MKATLPTEETAPADTGLRRAICVDIAPQPHLVAPVRHAVVATLRLWGVPEVADDMGLIATELVVNAIRHGDPGGVTVILTIRDSDAVLEVEDDNGGRPAVRQTAKDDEGGRGLILVQALADRWGYRPGSCGRKTVWASLALPEAGPEDAS
ncbi:ATP-binding protein [Streptomyces sp. NPDC050804]|uniref:ATP-binding protein n=1 Tax=Streptomyces sp. NPDC050804 TaxID=3154745 RepID=UPI00342C6651